MAAGNPDSRPNENPSLSLVLSIFKGENFVVKGPPCKAYLKAKCFGLQSDMVITSPVVKLTASNSEPEFNSQLAWSISKKQLRDLRSNRSTIRVACIVKDERTHKENEIGYVLLHVKDATTFARGLDVDPSKAFMFPLLGTKDSWQIVRPRLQMVLHLEDGLLPSRESENAKPVDIIKQNSDEPPGGVDLQESQMPIINAAELAETKLVRDMEPSPRFKWTVNDLDGYFRLGDGPDDNDLYVLNTTVISAIYLHCLWDGKSPRKVTEDNFYWQVKYIAYGCEISSEPFMLDKEHASRKTFIGDKATARIRTNGALLFEYLEETCLQFHIVRYRKSPQKELINGEVMGFCFASLDELTKKKELRLSLEVVSEWGTPRLTTNTASDTPVKPEILVLLTLQAQPNYFDGIDEMNNNQEQGKLKPVHKGFDSTDGAGHEASQVMEAQESHDQSPEVDIETLSNQSNVRRLLQFDNGIDTKTLLAQMQENLSPEVSSSKSKSSPLKINNQAHRLNDHKLSNATSCFSDSESDTLSNKENLAKLSPEPGNYKVSIKLDRFWFKSKKLITDEFVLSYVHPPIGIVSEPVEVQGHPINSGFVDIRQGFEILDGEATKAFKIKSLSESLLNNPLTVEFRRVLEDGGSSDVFATAMIPFGRIFLEKGHCQVWQLEDAADVLKNSSNQKIGTLFFAIRLTRDSDSPFNAANKGSKAKQSSFFPNQHSKKNSLGVPSKYYRDPDKVDQVTEEMREWRKTQEEMYRRQRDEKESAYLKLLSDEAAKRDAEREEVMSKKLSELDRKEKDLNRQRRHLEEKEEKLKLLELEVKDKDRQLCTEKDSLHQISEVGRRRLEEDHKAEVEGLTRRMQGYLEEVEKLKKKVSHMEKKLEAKDAEIDSLMASKRELPDSRLQERVALLEQENKSLKMKLREADTKKEQYKKQSLAICQKLQRVQEERDQELKEQNENLRLHILATKEHKELKKDRKAVQDLSHTIKALHKETIQPKPRNGKGDEPDIPGINVRELVRAKSRESEMNRLMEERSKLLQTGAYTSYDLLIKELESKMAALAAPSE